MELFLSICETYNVSPATSSEWMANIKRQYSGEKRYFHNVQLLEKKLDLIEEFAGDECFRNALVLATLFQYYRYDVKRDLKRENCDEFRLFIDQSGIKDVSESVSSKFLSSCSCWVFFRNLLSLTFSQCFRMMQVSHLKAHCLRSTCSTTLI